MTRLDRALGACRGFASVALDPYLLHVVIFWYILNSCPPTGRIVFNGQNSVTAAVRRVRDCSPPCYFFLIVVTLVQKN